MKKLFLSVLACSSIILTTNYVHAKEIIPEESNLVVNPNKVVQLEEVKKLIPDQIKLNMKDTDLFQNEETMFDSILYEKGKTFINSILRANVEFVTETITSGNYTYEQENFIVNGTKMYFDLFVTDWRTIELSIYERKSPDFYHCSSEEECKDKDIEKTLQFRKKLQVVYINHDQFDPTIEAYVKNAIQNVNFNKISSNFNLEYEESFHQFKDYVKKNINDDSLQLYFSSFTGGGDGDYSVQGIMIAIAKNGVVYEVVPGYDVTFNAVMIPEHIIDTDEAYIQYALPKIEEIWNQYSILNVSKLADPIISVFDTEITNDGTFYKILLSGDACSDSEECFARVILKKENKTKVIDHISISNDANITLKATKMDRNSSIYQEMFEKAKLNGFSNLFGAYELSFISGNIKDGLDITFSLGEQYNGINAYVLHQKSDGTYEEFRKKVENGTIVITVFELSPFLISLDETPNNVQTSSLNVLFYSIISASSLFFIVFLQFKKKMKRI